MGTLTNIFGRNVRYKRKSKGLTQRDLSRICNISVYQLNRFEKGVCTPNIEQAEAIACALSADISEFFR